jgi:hypothetical protein
VQSLVQAQTHPIAFRFNFSTALNTIVRFFADLIQRGRRLDSLWFLR